MSFELKYPTILTRGEKMASFVKAAMTSSVPEGSGTVLELEGKTIALFQVNGKFYAIDNTCKHRGGPLGEGGLDGNVVTCPWHGFQFDVTTGNCATNPAIAQTCYNVKVEGENVLIQL